MRTSAVLSTAVILFALVLIGCTRSLPQEGLWTGTLALPEERQLPFQMYLDLKGAAPTGYFINGPEHTPIPEIYHRGDSVIFVFSEYGAAMRSVWKSGRLSGKFLRFRKDTTAMALEATPVEATADTGKAVQRAEVPLVGKYQVYFRKDDKTDSSTTATFWVRGDSVFGTFIAPDGDLGLLAGKQSGNELELSRFTGWQANMLALRQERGYWWGKFFARTTTPAFFSLEPLISPPKELPRAQQTTMKNPRTAFTFSGVTITGDTVTQADARFKGKALIIDIMGTWCHNCMDASPLLQRLYNEFKDQGLEVVGLSFELSDDFITARKNLLLYEERYGITYTLLFCGTTESANVESRLRSQLNNFFAYPTTIFVDPKGIVRSIHVGFKGPGTGEEYQREVQKYYEMVGTLVKGKLASKK
ncbi:MAG: TlpA disulfide reductase family protein [Bacteroidota bacterium]